MAVFPNFRWLFSSISYTLYLLQSVFDSYPKKPHFSNPDKTHSSIFLNSDMPLIKKLRILERYCSIYNHISSCQLPYYWKVKFSLPIFAEMKVILPIIKYFSCCCGLVWCLYWYFANIVLFIINKYIKINKSPNCRLVSELSFCHCLK